jgi:hypothetical protein
MEEKNSNPGQKRGGKNPLLELLLGDTKSVLGILFFGFLS